MLTMLCAVGTIYAFTLASLALISVLYLVSPRFREHIFTADSPEQRRFRPQLTLMAEASSPTPASKNNHRLVA
jgi:hypothetical protein